MAKKTKAEAKKEKTVKKQQDALKVDLKKMTAKTANRTEQQVFSSMCAWLESHPELPPISGKPLSWGPTRAWTTPSWLMRPCQRSYLPTSYMNKFRLLNKDLCISLILRLKPALARACREEGEEGSSSGAAVLYVPC